MTDPRIAKAHTFALATHAAVGQYRKYSGEPYIVHPDECAAILQWLPITSNITVPQIIGMLLHDTVEDTRKYVDKDGNVLNVPSAHAAKGYKVTLIEGITFDLIYQEFNFGDPKFGDDVVRITSGLTDTSMPWDGNRAARKVIDNAHTAAQAPDVHTCKLADIFSNAPSIIEHDPGFARKWMPEKGDLLPILADGDPILHKLVTDQFSAWQNRQHNQGPSKS